MPPQTNTPRRSDATPELLGIMPTRGSKLLVETNWFQAYLRVATSVWIFLLDRRRLSVQITRSSFSPKLRLYGAVWLDKGLWRQTQGSSSWTTMQMSDSGSHSAGESLEPDDLANKSWEELYDRLKAQAAANVGADLLAAAVGSPGGQGRTAAARSTPLRQEGYFPGRVVKLGLAA